jgi:hypothetical protein
MDTSSLVSSRQYQLLQVPVDTYRYAVKTQWTDPTESGKTDIEVFPDDVQRSRSEQTQMSRHIIKLLQYAGKSSKELLYIIEQPQLQTLTKSLPKPLPPVTTI